MNLIITLAAVLLISYIFTWLARKIRIPSVVALILGGLVLGYPFFRELVIGSDILIISKLGDAALICLMFLAGLESSWKIIYKEKRDSFIIAVFASMTPFVMGFVIFRLLGFPLIVSFVIGICMSITAEATKARVLLELGKLRTRVGAAMMGTGIIDDILGLSLFVLVTYLLKAVYLKEDLLIAGAIISFFVGILVQNKIGRKNLVIQNLEGVLLLGVVPFFFISMGINFDLNSLIVNPFLLVIIIAIALVGKLSGTFLTKPLTKLKWKQLHLIGWGMNSRGAVELALALIAFRSNLIPVELYSSLIIMALITTLIFPFVITRMIKNNPRIMN